MKNKILICILAVLSILFLGSGICGYTLCNRNKNNNENNNDKITLTYEYYIEDIKVDNMPVNTDENKYIFNKYTCDNDIIGTFDNDSWTFNVDNKNSGTCKLYFVKENYNITITPVNGILDEKNVYTVKREDNGVFTITPNEGYKYKESNCSNNKIGTWDSSTNTFTLNAVTDDIACKVSFDIKELKIDITVKNGKTNTSEKVYYGDSKSIIVEPDSGYENPTIKCSNDQIATYENNSLNFEKITNDTSCKITFNKIKVKKYSLKIVNSDQIENITIIDGSEENNDISEGTSTSITLQSDIEDIIPNLDCSDDNDNKIIPNITDKNETKTTRTFEFLDVKNNITCKITNK